MSVKQRKHTDGNYKIVRNRDIRKITNMSKRHSRYTLNVLVPNTESLSEVEEALRRGIAQIPASPQGAQRSHLRGRDVHRPHRHDVFD